MLQLVNVKAVSPSANIEASCFIVYLLNKFKVGFNHTHTNSKGRHTVSDNKDPVGKASDSKVWGMAGGRGYSTNYNNN